MIWMFRNRSSDCKGRDFSNRQAASHMIWILRL